jgi:uncharacterized protein
MIMFMTLVMFFSSLSVTPLQQTRPGPSFPCESAQTAVEKLICSDRELSVLDLEYSHLYEQLLKTSDKNEAQSLQSNAKFFLESRAACTGEKMDDASSPSAAGCVANWYYFRIAELSETPTPPPTEWSPRLIGGVSIFIDRNRGLPQTRPQKPLPTVYFKPNGVDKFFKWVGAFEGPSPANMDWSGVYYVYSNVLGSLTYVVRYSNDRHLDESYFFNRDGRLAAQARRFDAKRADKIYAQIDTIYYGRNGKETRRIQSAWLDRKYTPIFKDLEPSPIEKPKFNSLGGLSDAIFKNAQTLNAGQLGICTIDLSDGYGSTTRILNLQAEPLDRYQRSLPPMNLRTFDNLDAVRGTSEGTTDLLGTLSGKKVYVVRYPSGLTGVLVERQQDRFLPVLYVNPEQSIERLGIMKMDNQEVLAYSTTLSGTGHFTQDWYFVIENGVPKSIHYQMVLNEELKKILPEKSGVWKGGGFNPDTLVFSNSVWREKDANCCPTGGSVEVVLGLDKGRFIVRSSRYSKPE